MLLSDLSTGSCPGRLGPSCPWECRCWECLSAPARTDLLVAAIERTDAWLGRQEPVRQVIAALLLHKSRGCHAYPPDETKTDVLGYKNMGLYRLRGSELTHPGSYGYFHLSSICKINNSQCVVPFIGVKKNRYYLIARRFLYG